MKKILSIPIILWLFSCNQNKSNVDQDQLIPRENIKCVLDSFVQITNDANLIHEIYIDKISPWEYDIVLYAGKKSLTEKGSVTANTEISGIKFDIYSGIEHYFRNPKDTCSFDDTPNKFGVPDGIYWILTDKDGQISIIKNSSAFPFYSMPNRVDFIPPTIKKK